MPPKLKFTEGKKMQHKKTIFPQTYIFLLSNIFFFKFPGEKVLCFHGPLLYEAKALKHQVTKDKQIKYFIHYAGWNKK